MVDNLYILRLNNTFFFFLYKSKIKKTLIIGFSIAEIIFTR